MKLLVKWLGFHSDTDIWKYFKQHWSHLFPKLLDRSQFVRQTANLWVVKQQMHQHLVKLLGADTADIHLVDGFSMDVCVATRAKNSTVYKGEAAYAYYAAKKKSFHSFQRHFMTDARGVPVAMTITAVSVDKHIGTYDLLHNVNGLLIEDKGYIKLSFKFNCHSYGIDLQTSLRKNMIDSGSK